MHISLLSTFSLVGPLLLLFSLSTPPTAGEPIPIPLSRLRAAPPQAQGHVDPRFARIKDKFQSYLTSDYELGSSLSINIGGKQVVDLWGGYADVNKTKPWTRDTLVNVWSTGKTLVSLAALTLIERGQLDPYAKVATYWPEFAANGKQDIEVRHLLSHTAGLAAFEVNTTVQDLYNSSLAASRLAAQKTLWDQRNVSGYHAVTYGYPIGELIRRVTGKTMKQFIAEEISGPLKADFSIGVPEKDWGRVADLVPPPPIAPPDINETSIAFRAFANPPVPAQVALTPDWRNAEIGASNGHASAIGVTRALSTITLGGKACGVRLLSPRTIDLIFRQQSNGTDLVIGTPITFGIGYALVRNGSTGLTAGAVPEGGGHVAYWGGIGGSAAFMDLDNGITFAYVMNKMKGDLTGTEAFQQYAKILYEVIGKS